VPQADSCTAANSVSNSITDQWELAARFAP